MTYLDDVQRLLHAALLVKGEARIHLRRDLARHDLQDLAAELDEQVVHGRVDLVVHILAVLLAVRDRLVDELRVLGLLGGLEDEGRVGGGVLRLVLVDGGEVTAVADDSLGENVLVSGSAGRMTPRSRTYGAGGFELVERRRHDCGSEMRLFGSSVVGLGVYSREYEFWESEVSKGRIGDSSQRDFQKQQRRRKTLCPTTVDIRSGGL